MKTVSWAAATLLVASFATTPAFAATGDNTQVEIDETFSQNQIAQARKEGRAREAAGRDSAADRALERQLLVTSAEEGSPLTDEDVSVLHLGELVSVAVPETIELTSVEVVGDTELGVSVAVEAGESAAADSIASPGPGMGSWGNRVDGQYVLTVQDPRVGTTEVIGTGTFLWAREKYTNDGNGTYDWWMYTRQGIGQPRNVEGDNWQIPKLRVQSYPYDSVEPGLVNWTGMDPAADFTGRCSSSSFTTGISTPVFNAGYSFVDCDGYTVWHNPTNPGSYHITMDQGSWVNEGSRAAGYSLGWKSKQGTAGSMHDYQRILFQRGPTDSSATTCDSYNANKVCNGW